MERMLIELQFGIHGNESRFLSPLLALRYHDSGRRAGLGHGGPDEEYEGVQHLGET